MIRMSKRTDHLYLHVPFCKTICSYCDFPHQSYQPSAADQWLAALKSELSAKKINPECSTIYIGGGTPTALGPEQLDQLLTLLDPYTGCVQEYTIEINPETLDEEKAELLYRHGINRASIGFQSGDPVLLKLMNRHHTKEDTDQAVRLLRAHGIDNISLDILYSLPGETLEQVKETVREAIAMNPDHLSLYSLTIEPHTVFAAKHLSPCDADLEADMYEWICQTLPASGYQQYEISNFAKDGKQSMHNCAYWNYEDFYGISLGASGKDGTHRYDNTRSMKEYLSDPCAHTDIELSKEDLMFEMLMMGMRLKQGMDQQRFKDMFHVSVDEAYPKAVAKLKQENLIQEDEHYLWACGHGYEILNDVLEEFLPD